MVYIPMTYAFHSNTVALQCVNLNHKNQNTFSFQPIFLKGAITTIKFMSSFLSLSLQDVVHPIITNNTIILCQAISLCPPPHTHTRVCTHTYTHRFSSYAPSHTHTLHNTHTHTLHNTHTHTHTTLHTDMQFVKFFIFGNSIFTNIFLLLCNIW